MNQTTDKPGIADEALAAMRHSGHGRRQASVRWLIIGAPARGRSPHLPAMAAIRAWPHITEEASIGADGDGVGYRHAAAHQIGGRGSEQSGTLATVLAAGERPGEEGLASRSTPPSRALTRWPRAARRAGGGQMPWPRPGRRRPKPGRPCRGMRQVAELSGARCRAPPNSLKPPRPPPAGCRQRGQRLGRRSPGRGGAEDPPDHPPRHARSARRWMRVVLTRKVEPGQSVVAAMTIPVLFTPAEDLARMELQVKVDEADGTVRLGRPASRCRRGPGATSRRPSSGRLGDDHRQTGHLQTWWCSR